MVGLWLWRALSDFLFERIACFRVELDGAGSVYTILEVAVIEVEKQSHE
jgi:hypothetical protein